MASTAKVALSADQISLAKEAGTKAGQDVKDLDLSIGRIVTTSLLSLSGEYGDNVLFALAVSVWRDAFRLLAPSRNVQVSQILPAIREARKNKKALAKAEAVSEGTAPVSSITKAKAKAKASAPKAPKDERADFIARTVKGLAKFPARYRAKMAQDIVAKVTAL